MDERSLQQVIVTPSSISISNSPGSVSNSSSPASTSDSDEKHYEESHQKRAKPPKNKQKSSEASARFRTKRKLKQQKILDAIERENSKIEQYKSRMKKLQVENELLKKMVLGPSIPSPLDYNDIKLSSDIGNNIGNMSNYELLKKLNRDDN